MNLSRPDDFEKEGDVGTNNDSLRPNKRVSPTFLNKCIDKTFEIMNRM